MGRAWLTWPDALVLLPVLVECVILNLRTSLSMRWTQNHGCEPTAKRVAGCFQATVCFNAGERDLICTLDCLSVSWKVDQGKEKGPCLLTKQGPPAVSTCFHR
jgi:hypothetical protein